MEGMCQSSGSCQTDQDRQTQSSVEALCSAPSETRAQGPRPGMQATCGTFCEPGRWWAGPVKMAQNFPISKLPSFDSAFLWLLQNFAGIMTVDSYSFCFFFFFSWKWGEFGAVHSTVLIKPLPLLLLLLLSRFSGVQLCGTP